MLKFKTNEERYNLMKERVDDLRQLYMMAECYNDDTLENDEDDVEEPEQNEEEKEEECDTGDKPKKLKRYFYFGGLLYPTKNERHYKIFQRLPLLGCSYSMTFHFKEYHSSMKRIQQKAYLVGQCNYMSDVIYAKSQGNKFFDVYGSGQELRLIEPHIHFLLRWDNKISVKNMANILNLEENLIKFKASDGKFLKSEFNALNYQLHLGRSHFKFKKDYYMDLNTDFNDDVQDRADYSLDDVVACPKWYKMLMSQVDEFGDVRGTLISEFYDFLISSPWYIRRDRVLAWFSDKPLYAPYWESNKQYVRSDLIEMIKEHNRAYEEQIYSMKGKI